MIGPEILRARISRACAAAICAFWATCAPGLSAAATPVATAADEPAAANHVAEPADLVLANRRIVTLRSTAFGATPAERAHAIAENFRLIVSRGGPLEVTTSSLPEGIAILIDGRPAFRVLQGDANPENGETTETVAAEAKRNLQLATRDVRESRDSQAMLEAGGKALATTLALVVALWLLIRAAGWATRKVHAVVDRRAARFAPAWSEHVIGPGGFGDLVVMPVKALAWAIALLILYQWAALVLRFFPYTRPWGEALFQNLVDALTVFGNKLLGAIPGLLFVVLIFVTTRFVVRLVRAFFDRVQAGRVRLPWIDDTTARPTGKLLITAIWILGFVAAYPYIPGSNSEAFKGIGVFVGLMASIGASGIVNQAVSGLMLMYTRALRPGEFVQIGDVEGTVRSIGFLTSRIETLRNVEISVPNAFIAQNVTRNYSRLAANGGMRLTTAVTIGYDTPWRQVQAMLQIAANRTGEVSKDPTPRVLQTGLQDFYVEYTLVVSISDPRRKAFVLNELHANIQDAFNEHGVQIMSPHYESDPAQVKVVPEHQWFVPPATPGAGVPDTAATSSHFETTTPVPPSP